VQVFGVSPKIMVRRLTFASPCEVSLVSPARVRFRARCAGLLIPFLKFAVLWCGCVGCVPAQIGSGIGGSSISSSTPGAPISAGAPSTVAGQVINASTNAPVARALVRMNGRAMLTDHEGKFRFEQNTETAANLLVTKPGFYPSTELNEAGNQFLQGAQLGAQIELRLYPEALLTGTVLAPDGTPLSRIQVAAQRLVYDDNGHRWLTAGSGQTDAHGRFRIPVPAGDYRLETWYSMEDQTIGEAVLPVQVPGGSSSNTSQMIHIHSGEEQHFDLRPGVSPTHSVGIAQPASGPGGRSFMRISARTSDGSTLQINAMTGGPSGETTVRLPQGTYTLTAQIRANPDAPEQAETRVTVPDHDISGVVLQFSPVPSIPVEMAIDSSATSDNSQPNLTQFGLALQSELTDPERGDSNIFMSERPDKSYGFSVSPGTYRLAARDNGIWFIKSASYGDSDLMAQELVVAPGASGTPIRVTVSNQTAALQGSVNLNGEPVAAYVYLIPTMPSTQEVFTTRSSSSGSYTFAHVPPGSYRVIAFERRHSANYRDPESVAPYSAQVHSVSLNAGDKPTVVLDAVPAAEVAP
jgi:hypothetical protein